MRAPRAGAALLAALLAAHAAACAPAAVPAPGDGERFELAEPEAGDENDLPPADIDDGDTTADMPDTEPDGGQNEPDDPDGSDDVPEGADEADAAEAAEAADTAPACTRWGDIGGGALAVAINRTLVAEWRDIKPADPTPYDEAREIIYRQVEAERRSGVDTVECVYTGERFVLPARGDPPVDVLNIEHAWPRSRMPQDALYEKRIADLHNLWPAKAAVNQYRFNYFYGEPVSDIDTTWPTCRRGLDANGETVFEGRAERRGDTARSWFYMSVRWGLYIVDRHLPTLLRWHAADPPDDRERLRNDLVSARQGVRNPFIDCPELVDRIGRFEAFAVTEPTR